MDDTRDSHLLIVGTGAMACLFGARLSPLVRVTLLGTWQDGLTSLRTEGIRLEDDGFSRTAPVHAISDPAECRGTRHALVLVKSWQTARAARQLQECLAPDGVALTLQNGLGNRERLEQALGPERVAQGVTTCGVTLLGPAHARLGGEGITYVAQHPRLAPLVALLREAGFVVEEVADVESLAWGKVVVNAAINPITALLRVPNGDLLSPSRSAAWRSATEAAEEAAAVARARGIRLPFNETESHVAEVARKTAANRSSMLQDVERGRPTEIDAICGAVVAEGERAGVATPVNRVLWDLVRSLGPQPNGSGA
jgi:2-dehydropantoate 2-reductase